MRRQALKYVAGFLIFGGSLPLASVAATFGTVVPIGGESADIALDELRGQLYMANFTAGEIDVLSLATNAIQTAMHVAPGPSALALSPDKHFLVVVHFGNLTSPASPTNAITILDLVGGGRQTLALSTPPLGVAFGADGLALIATTTQFLLLNPASGQIQFLTSVSNASANSIPAAPGTPPVEIIAATMTASADGQYIFGLTDSIRFVYQVSIKNLSVNGYAASPVLGPRVISAAADGSYVAAGWAIFNRAGIALAQFPNPSGQLAVGSHAIDSAKRLIYAQIPPATPTPGSGPMLTIADTDNLTVHDKLQLPENLTGRSVLNSAGSVMYSVSESGITILPVGSLNQAHRLTSDHQDLVFRGNFCQSGVITQSFQLTDPGGGQTAFSLSANIPGVTISPSSGSTPATIQVQIDTTAFQNVRGTTAGLLTIFSSQAVNLPPPIRLLVNNQRPDERGYFTDVPGTLVDLLADPVRNRFYILRQDQNQLLVFDGATLSQIATLRTGATPTRMALTFDNKYLLVGHDNSMLAYVYDLDALTPVNPVVFPIGHYPRSIAASGHAILAASRVSGGTNTIDEIDLAGDTATPLPSLGVFQNTINIDTVLAPAPNGSTILIAGADGSAFLYDASSDTFTVSRSIGTTLSGAYAASGDGWFVVGNTVLNSSLVPVATLGGSQLSYGFTFSAGQGIEFTGPASGTGDGGVIQRVNLQTASPIVPTRVAEQPLVSSTPSAFTRTLAPLMNGNAIIALTVSGFTALPASFDAAVVPPSVASVVNAADLSSTVAPGSLISVFGANLSAINIASSEIPLPTALGESCLTANGAPIPMLFASPSQINAQLPTYLSGNVTMNLYTPGGESDDYYMNVQPVAPAIFQDGTAGPLTGIPIIIKASNQQLVTPTNPIHPGDVITIYTTGLGLTSPQVPAGWPAPLSPPALPLIAPAVQLGGVAMSISYAGLAPGEVGVYQINAQAPAKLPIGDQVPLTINQAGVSTSVDVRVVD
ncbi:MAG TPA: hypothetical protein VKV17_14780 [Bryobacteraceae bacterium]|nr:hypothetical protein [Bryobacteraceae bacterium]